MITVSYEIDPSHKEVIDAAVEMITETMKHGAASNGEGTWCNKDGLNYHVRKAVIHITSLWQSADLESREREEPKLRHLYNAVTRMCMAHADQRRLRKAVIEAHEED